VQILKTKSIFYFTSEKHAFWAYILTEGDSCAFLFVCVKTFSYLLLRKQAEIFSEIHI